MIKSILEELLNEKKDHLIKNLKNLSSDQKDKLIDLFKKKPNLENKVDWNNKNLKYVDFKDVLKTTKTERKKKVKEMGIKGLVERKDFLVAPEVNGMRGFIPLHYEASKLLASDKIGGCEGKWCTAFQKDDGFFIEYVILEENILVYYIDFENSDKNAVRYNSKTGKVVEARDKENDNIMKTWKSYKLDKKTITKARNQIDKNFKEIDYGIHEDVRIRKLYFKLNPDDERGGVDENKYIRAVYFEQRPNDKRAGDDEYKKIRAVYFEQHPNDKRAGDDDEFEIRVKYFDNHPDDKRIATDEDGHIRVKYFWTHLDDKRAATDEYWIIRSEYFKKYPDDERAGTDKNEEIKDSYFKRHPEKRP